MESQRRRRDAHVIVQLLIFVLRVRYVDITFKDLVLVLVLLSFELSENRTRVPTDLGPLSLELVSIH